MAVYTTWMSGFGLFTVLYLFSPNTYLIDKNVLDMGPVVAVASALGFLAAGWIVYDSLCRIAWQQGLACSASASASTC